MISYASIQKRNARKAAQPARASESAEQRAVIDWAHRQVNVYPELALLFHIPNGGKRDARTGAMLKKQGVVAGVPDLLLCCARHGHHGLWIEMKAQKGRVSEAQSTMIDQLRAQGYLVAVSFGQDAAKWAIATYLGIKL